MRLVVLGVLLLAASPAVADPVSAFLITFKSLTINSVLTKIAVSLAVSLISRALFKPKARPVLISMRRRWGALRSCVPRSPHGV